MQVLQKMTICQQCQVRIFIIIDELSKVLLAQGPQKGLDNKPGLSGSGCPGDKHSPSGIDDIDPSVVIASMPVGGGQVEGMIVVKQAFFLGKCFVVVVEYLGTKAALDHP